MEAMQYHRKHVTACFVLHYRYQTPQKSRASLQVPNTSKKLKALRLLPRAFICFSVSGTRDEALALVFDILLEGPLHCRMEIA